MTRLLLVGCGKIARAAHLPALRDLQPEGRAEVTVCDLDHRRAESAAAEFGVRSVAASWDEAAAEADAVAVCLPPGPNAEVAAGAAGLGLHVMCEKPPGRTVADARAMAESASLHPTRVTMVAFNRRFNPLYRRAIAASVALGPPTSFYGRFSQPALGGPPNDTVEDWITSDSSHALDLAVATIGYPRAVVVDRRALGGGVDNAWTCQLRSDQGSAVLLLHFAAGHRVERYEWAGPGYDVALDLPKRAEWAQSGKVERWNAEGGFHQAGGFTDEYRSFLAAIDGNAAAPAADFAYAVDFMHLVEAVLSSEPGVVRGVDPPSPPRARAGQPAGPSTSTVPPATRAPSRPVVLLHQPPATLPRFFSVENLSALRQRYDVRAWAAVADRQALEAAHAIVTGRAAKPLPEGLLDAAGQLRLLVVIGASVRGVGPELLADRGVTICNTADAVAQSVAEHCLMAALAGLRRLPQTDRAMHRGGWPRPGPAPTRLGPRALVRRLPLPPAVRTPLGRIERRVAGLVGRHADVGVTTVAPGAPSAGGGHDLRGEVVGLVGWGNTARRFAELLAPFECRILVASEAASQTELDRAGARRASLGEVLGASRVVSLHKGLTDRTHGFLDARRLAQIRPGAVLVNTARGGLIDENALVNRLARGDIVAALDVFEEEPLPRRHPLRRLPNVILTPHHASTTAQEELRMGEQAVATLLDWADGRPVVGIEASRLANMT